MTGVPEQTVEEGETTISTIGNGTAFVLKELLLVDVQPPEVMPVTVKVPEFFTTIFCVVSPVDHKNEAKSLTLFSRPILTASISFQLGTTAVFIAMRITETGKVVRGKVICNLRAAGFAVAAVPV